MNKRRNLRVIVCGGRKYGDRAKLWQVLDHVHAERGISAVIHGAMTGADTLAGEWAKERGVEPVPFPAKWTEFGRAAGPKRNRQMLAEGKPDGVIAFPGGTGTADMVAVAKAAGVPVWQVV